MPSTTGPPLPLPAEATAAGTYARFVVYLEDGDVLIASNAATRAAKNRVRRARR
ncbi:MAG TPA: hypothetical protein VNF71_07285 [Acidimicrobiales bacterium]|nr:hypothetical protein [Acidimicrobiales bacterium]